MGAGKGCGSNLGSICPLGCIGSCIQLSTGNKALAAVGPTRPDARPVCLSVFFMDRVQPILFRRYAEYCGNHSIGLFPIR